jgi:hypothetical protein
VIGYATFVENAPVSVPKADHDAWFEESGYDVDDLLRVGRELAENRLAGVPDGTRLTQDDLSLALISAFLFGFELAVRCEQSERSDA